MFTSRLAPGNVAINCANLAKFISTLHRKSGRGQTIKGNTPRFMLDVAIHCVAKFAA